MTVRFHDDVYGVDHQLIVGRKNAESIIKKYGLKWDEGFNAVHYYIYSHSISIILLESMGWTTVDYGTLAHECLHSALRIMGHRGCMFDSEDSEPLAYYFSYIYRTHLRRLNAKRRRRIRSKSR